MICSWIILRKKTGFRTSSEVMPKVRIRIQARLRTPYPVCDKTELNSLQFAKYYAVFSLTVVCVWQYDEPKWWMCVWVQAGWGSNTSREKHRDFRLIATYKKGTKWFGSFQDNIAYLNFKRQCRWYIKLSQKFPSFYKKIPDAQYFLFYIIIILLLENWSYIIQ